jgi:hypothetical protein
VSRALGHRGRRGGGCILFLGVRRPVDVGCEQAAWRVVESLKKKLQNDRIWRGWVVGR